MSLRMKRFLWLIGAGMVVLMGLALAYTAGTFLVAGDWLGMMIGVVVTYMWWKVVGGIVLDLHYLLEDEEWVESWWRDE